MLLQRIELDVPSEISPLFLPQPEQREFRLVGGRVIVAPGGACALDSYFGCFWENYWMQFTRLQTVTLRAEVTGTGALRVMRRTPQLDDYVVGEAHFDSDQPFEIEIQAKDDAEFRGQAGRLWMEIVADAEVELSRAEWCTDQQPARSVALNVVFCTMNRLDYLRRIVQEIDSDPQVADSVERVTIVNQGDSFTVQDLLPQPNPSSTLRQKLVIIEQDNLGGCGGFTRGLVETLRDPSTTHALLLDDDIRMHAESLLRASRFLAYSEDDVALGGHMLNLHRPLMVYEAGAQLDPVTLKALPNNLESDASDSEDLDSFIDAQPVAYNGWWFFGTSREQIERIGLPLPCFIRGDDVEYGVRIARSGERTVAVPGIAVWHEPFYMKLGGWQFYFETRNRLEMAAIHGIGSWSGIKRNLFLTFVRDVAMARYHSVMFMLNAIDDYLAGPEVAIGTTDAELKRCREIASEFGPKRVGEHIPVSDPPETVLRKIEKRLPGHGYFARMHTAATSLTRFVRVRKFDDLPTFRAKDLEPDLVAGLASYQVQEQFGNGVWLYEHRPEVEKELWRRALNVIPQLQPLDSYREAFAKTSQWRDWWAEQFGPATARRSEKEIVA